MGEGYVGSVDEMVRMSEEFLKNAQSENFEDDE